MPEKRNFSFFKKSKEKINKKEYYFFFFSFATPFVEVSPKIQPLVVGNSTQSKTKIFLNKKLLSY